MNESYERHYHVGLLDDLHNYFPALLYAPERFGSVADMLVYMRDQTQRQFDLFSAGRRRYMREREEEPRGAGPAAAAAAAPFLNGFGGSPLGAGTPQAPRAPRAPAAPLVPSPMTPPLQTPPALPRQRLSQTNSLLQTVDLLSLMFPQVSTAAAPGILDLFGGGGAAILETVLPNPAAMEPVIVRPTRTQIQAGSTLETVDAEEDICAICQDAMEPGSEARNLTYCDHRFHPGCIDTWFQRDVHCPVCRHDIRELGEAPAAPARQN